jgi:hypothetical protein
MSLLSRRELLQMTAAGSLGSTAAGSRAATQDRTGTSHERDSIELYTSALSAVAGETVAVHVSTTSEQFAVEIARIGAREEILLTKERCRGEFHSTPDDAWENGCRWPVSFEFEVPAGWRSGYYEIKARTSNGAIGRAFVVVRAAQPTAKMLLVLATNTYAAYNTYGGACFYQKKSFTQGSSIDRGEPRVSFLRPWTQGTLWLPESAPRFAQVDEQSGFIGTGRWAAEHDIVGGFAAGFANYERKLVRWMERNGYDVDYAVNGDLELHPDLLGRYRLMISAGHDEYWSWGMRDAVESFVANGGNACFFSGNISMWQARFEDGGNTLVSYKYDYRQDPVYDTPQRHLTTTFWNSPIVGRAEGKMTGLCGVYGGFAHMDGATQQGAGGYLVYRPDHWVFAGTGLEYGELLGSASTIVGYEVDGCPIRMQDGLPFPAEGYDAPASMQILGMIPAALTLRISGVLLGQQEDFRYQPASFAREVFGRDDARTVAAITHNHAVMSILTNNGTVFCAGTTDWVFGLTGKDPAVERITRNLLDRLSA